MTAPPDPYRPFRRYRYYDLPGHMIYVGSTCRPSHRAAWHSRRSAWWPLVDHSLTRTDDYATAEQCAAAERDAYDRVLAAGGTLFNRERPTYAGRIGPRAPTWPPEPVLPPLPAKVPETPAERTRREARAASFARWRTTGEWTGADPPAWLTAERWEDIPDPLADVHPRYLR